jgi:hypothetical protein
MSLRALETVVRVSLDEAISKAPSGRGGPATPWPGPPRHTPLPTPPQPPTVLTAVPARLPIPASLRSPRGRSRRWPSLRPSKRFQRLRSDAEARPRSGPCRHESPRRRPRRRAQPRSRRARRPCLPRHPRPPRPP